MRRLGVIVLVSCMILAPAGCSDDDELETSPTTMSAEAADEPVAGQPGPLANVDFLVTMRLGSGPGPQAEELVTDMADAVPGTADHLASVVTADGVVNIVAYQEVMRGPRMPGGVMFCVAELGPRGTGAGCSDQPTTEPEAGSGSSGNDRNSITAYGGDDAPFAVLVTDRHIRIGIVTARGWVYADWPSAWGLPGTITFYDGEGNAGFESSYDWGL